MTRACTREAADADNTLFDAGKTRDSSPA